MPIIMTATPARMSRSASSQLRPMLSEERNQRAQQGAKSDDDRVGQAESEARYRDSEQHLSNSPSRAKKERHGQLKQGEATVGVEEVVDET